MILLKSVLGGLLALIFAVILLVVGAAVIGIMLSKRQGEAVIGFDPISMARSFPLLWVIALCAALGIFALGFYWEYRRGGLHLPR